jgi:hypothetical protein
MAKNIRNTQGMNAVDPSSIDLLEYNNAAGSKKVSEVGRALIPISYISAGALAYTCDASTARNLGFAGKCLAVYNNAGSVGSITLGTSAPTSLAPGVTNVSGQCGIACMPNAWTYIACNNNNWVISSAATLLVYVIDDDTQIKQEAKY